MVEINPKNPEELYNNLIAIAKKLKDSSGLSVTNQLRYNFCKIFGELQTVSLEKKYYWDYCNVAVYKIHFQERMKSFLLNQPGANEFDFIESEKEQISNLDKDGELNIKWHIKIDYKWEVQSPVTKNGMNFIPVDIKLNFLDFNVIQGLKIEYRRKLQFLEEQKKKLQEDILLHEKEKIEINPTTLRHFNEIGIIDILKEKFPMLADSEYKLNFVLKEIINWKQTHYYRIGLLIHLGIYEPIKENIKNEFHVINPNRIAKKINTLFKVKITSIVPIFQAYEKNDTKSPNYPYKEKVKKQIQKKLSEIGL